MKEINQFVRLLVAQAVAAPVLHKLELALLIRSQIEADAETASKQSNELDCGWNWSGRMLTRLGKNESCRSLQLRDSRAVLVPPEMGGHLLGLLHYPRACKIYL